MFTPEGGTLDYSKLWYTLSVIGLLTAVGFGIFFRDETQPAAASAIPPGDAAAQAPEGTD